MHIFRAILGLRLRSSKEQLTKTSRTALGVAMLTALPDGVGGVHAGGKPRPQPSNCGTVVQIKRGLLSKIVYKICSRAVMSLFRHVNCKRKHPFKTL